MERGRTTREVFEEGVRDVLTTGDPAATSLCDIYVERIGQLVEFPEAEDDALLPAEWVARIAKHLGRAVSRDRDEYRRSMVVVGALALAAVESFDRKHGGRNGA